MNDTSRPQARTILVIDDDRDITEIIQLAFDDSDREVLVSHSAEAGIAQYQEHNDEIDLVLLDLALNGRSGIDVLERLQSLPGTARIIIMSGYMASPQEAIALGAHAVLPKPFNLNELEDAVKALQ